MYFLMEKVVFLGFVVSRVGIPKSIVLMRMLSSLVTFEKFCGVNWELSFYFFTACHLQIDGKPR